MKKPSKAFCECFSPRAMRLAWERYLRMNQREAKDYSGVRSFGSRLGSNLDQLSKKVISGTYRPVRPAKFYMPKSSGMQRTITILQISDALVYQAVANSVAMRCYNRLAENNDFVFGSVLNDEVKLGTEILGRPRADYYFFKPWVLLYKEFADSVNKAVRASKVEFKFETDITGFYDNIPHYNLLSTLSDLGGTANDVLDLLGECLNVWSGTRDGSTPGVGIPQATGASHFLANLFLHELDNFVKDQGLPYYRYMDDMRIYGYTEGSLRAVLVQIDRYLKGHALSLNAKKTKIQRITPEDEPKSLISFEYASQLPTSESSAESDFAVMAQQECPSVPVDTPVLETPARCELLDLCIRDMAEVSESVGRLSHAEHRAAIDFDDRAVQRGFMHDAFRFRQARTILKRAGRRSVLRKGDVLNGWLFLADKYYWTIHQFCWVLSLYEGDKRVKKRLTEMIRRYDSYEWVQAKLYECLAVSQVFASRELRDLFEKLKSDVTSWYVKRALYLLLLRHCKERQFFMSILARASTEPDPYLKREVLFLAVRSQAEGISRSDLLEAFGVT
jgi:retron-type reverse transcriptase